MPHSYGPSYQTAAEDEPGAEGASSTATADNCANLRKPVISRSSLRLCAKSSGVNLDRALDLLGVEDRGCLPS
jgi:hypothetical protein